MLASRAAFASLPPLSVPPPPTPLQAPVSQSPRRTPSRPIPRSPYVNISPQRYSRPEIESRPPSPIPSESPTLEDVLNEGDWVGEGLRLQGELVRTVPVPNAPQSNPNQLPAKWFEVVRKLGSGSYAVVYLVREILSPTTLPSHDYDDSLDFADDFEFDVPTGKQPTVYGREFAIKCLSKANLNRDALEAQLFEATVHQSLPAHPNIVTLYRTLETDSFLLLLLELVPGEDLFYFLEQARDHSDEQIELFPEACPSVTPPTPSLLSSLHPAQLLSHNRLRLIASMFFQMCDAVAHCHRVSVFHRDIKPENFIVTDAYTEGPDGRRERRVVVKLTDFGLATTDVQSTDMDCGSAPYMSYECRNNCAPTYSTRAADVWSLGIVLINMLYHHNPWSDTTDGVCPSFEAFRREPVNFFMQRFTGMTRQVAEFLANRVFCIIEDTPNGEADRITAEEFGLWIKHLPAMLAQSSAPHRPMRTILNPVVPMPPSRRPSSRQTSIRGESSRSSSQRGKLLPLSTNVETDLPPDLPEEDDETETADACSRTTSNARRRKRGARKGKAAQAALSDQPPRDLAQDLAVASQVLAREISKSSKSSAQSSTVTASPKKPSRWQTLLRMSSHDNMNPLNVPPPVPFLPPEPPAPRSVNPQDSTSRQRRQQGTYVPRPSSTAENVSQLIMGLSAASPQPKAEQWGRGRRGPSPTWRADVPPQAPFTKAAQFERANRSPSVVSGPIDKQSDRGTSPHSNRGPSSSNWRNSSSASSFSATTSFTRFSNSSMRSVSTVATSVSAASSWRNPHPPKDDAASTTTTTPVGKKAKAPLPPPPANLKIISGVPWELGELPRGLHGRPNDHIFAPPPVRFGVKAPRNQPAATAPPPLDTINERGTTKSPVYQRTDVPQSSSDIGDAESSSSSEAPKKVQKAQINTLAKMLSALKASRGTH
ncbi:hypothetical protein M422DRAFT_27953 [Sphaerobolus stellatus SS14]|nr:hypothetical protein M422DRAFT_27953 [Sphaerobolus stellatus SS14]